MEVNSKRLGYGFSLIQRLAGAAEAEKYTESCLEVAAIANRVFLSAQIRNGMRGISLNENNKVVKAVAAHVRTDNFPSANQVAMEFTRK